MDTPDAPKWATDRSGDRWSFGEGGRVVPVVGLPDHTVTGRLDKDGHLVGLSIIGDKPITPRVFRRINAHQVEGFIREQLPDGVWVGRKPRRGEAGFAEWQAQVLAVVSQVAERKRAAAVMSRFGLRSRTSAGKWIRAACDTKRDTTAPKHSNT